jgi:cytochrome c556
MKVSSIAVLVAVAGVSASVWVAAASQTVVDQRVSGMKSLIGAMRAANGAQDAAVARESLAKAIAYAKSIPGQFPKGTGIGDSGITKTRAKQEIWTKPAVFKAEADGFLAALEAASAAADDRAKYESAMDVVRKSCSSCHDAFRGPATD